MEGLPVVVKAKYEGAFLIHLTFSDATEGTVDFEEWLDGPIFEALRDTAFFQRFFIEAGSISWPNGADIAPEALYQRAISSTAA